MYTLGIDIGGTGIKGALVDPLTGERVGQRVRVDTPSSRQPDPVLDAVVDVLSQLRVQHADQPISPVVGVGFPAVVVQGRPRTPFTSHQIRSWVDYPVADALAKRSGADIVLLNDADAAGLAEARFGAARRQTQGVVLVLTLGTGIGSALLKDGELIPNTELGHLYLRGHDAVAEAWASERSRKEQDLSWGQWSARLQEYLLHIERLFTPDLVVLGGGVAKKHHKFLHRLQLQAPVVPAELLNHAGLVGAALAAVNSRS